MPRPYSTKPKQVRDRIRKTSEILDRDVEILYGKPIDRWDFEELQRGRTREPDGSFHKGATSKWLSDVVRGEIYKRLQVMTRHEISSHAGTAIEVIVGIMRDDRTDEDGRPLTPSSVKLDAAKYLLDQLIGKATSKVELSGEIDLKHFLAGVMVNPDGEDAHPVLEGAVEEVTDDDAD